MCASTRNNICMHYSCNFLLIPRNASNVVDVGALPAPQHNRAIVLRRGQSLSPTFTTFDVSLAISEKLIGKWLN